MTYGLYDADLQYYPIPFYNLELMKLSSYYKHKREIVGLSPDFSPHRYNHFIIRQDFYNPFATIYKGNNISYGGRAFDGEKYKPLPLEIESVKPDILLYNSLKPHEVKGYNASAFSTMRRAEHLRLSLDGKTIWKDFEKQLRHDNKCYGVIFHDYNLNEIEEAYELISHELPSWIKIAGGRRVGMKFPIQVDNKEDMYKWLNLTPMTEYYSLQHNGLIDNSYIPMLAETPATFTTMRQVTVDISNSFTYEELINGGIQRIFRSIINLRSHKLVFLLKYNEDIFIDNDWKNVMKLIAKYNHHLLTYYFRKNYFKYTEPYETLYSYCKGSIKSTEMRDPLLKKEFVQSVFQFVRENNYDLFKDFYEYRGGEVKNDR